MLQSLKKTVRGRFQFWLNRRLPATRSITLNQRRIFIFPSRPGLYFLLVLAVILLAAINYQNNMVFALVFLLASVYVVTILHTYGNFSGLSITAVRAYPAFAGDLVRFDLKISRLNGRRYYDIALCWPGTEPVYISLDEYSETIVPLFLPAEKRGLFKPPRLLLETCYPLGVMRAWTWLALDFEAIVYPRPIAGEWNRGKSGETEDGEAAIAAGSDDFYAFKNYQPGDPLKHIAWKQFAKGRSLQTKQFADYRDQQLWLDFSSFSGDREQRLSAICYWVLRLEQQQHDYGLRLPNLVIEPGRGEVHCDHLLKALALFGVGRDE